MGGGFLVQIYLSLFWKVEAVINTNANAPEHGADGGAVDDHRHGQRPESTGNEVSGTWATGWVKVRSGSLDPANSNSSSIAYQ